MLWLIFQVVDPLVAFAESLLKGQHSHPPYPPGPPAYPIIGHAGIMPSGNPSQFFCELGREYGDIVYLQIFGSHIVVINRRRAAVDLLSKKSRIFDGRPQFLLPRMLGMEKALGFLDSRDNHFTEHKRIVKRFFAKEEISAFRSSWVREARILVDSLGLDTSDWDQSIKHYTMATIIKIMYGHSIESNDDPYMRLAIDANNILLPIFNNYFGMASTLVFPFLRYLPSWLPGAYWAQRARSARSFVKRLQEYPLKDTMSKILRGTAEPSLAVNHLSDIHEGEQAKHFQDLMAGLYAAGPLSTSATLFTFVTAMLLFPECQRKAQEEIDRVVGTGRLPDFDDMDSLPYVNSLIEETLRWQPAVPLGLPHLAIEDYIYNGMLIPEGATVIANARSMSLDSDVYEHPDVFDPTRFLPTPNGRAEPYFTEAFGFGHRACPGVFLVKDSLWIAIATILATFFIAKPVDEKGEEYTPAIKFGRETVTCAPEPFPCRMLPRKRDIPAE